MARRRNGDAQMRMLERAAKLGDPRAYEALTVERIRRGLDSQVSGIMRASLSSLKSWLRANDPNGDYDDVTLHEARSIAARQVLDGRPSPPGTRSAFDYLRI